VTLLLLALLADGVDWRADYDAARAEAREKKRLVVLHFYMPGRPICRAMEEETFAHAEVARAIRERFVGVRLDVEAKPELFEAAIGSRGVLATCVMDSDGDVVSELRGYAGPQAFLKFLEKAESGHARSGTPGSRWRPRPTIPRRSSRWRRRTARPTAPAAPTSATRRRRRGRARRRPRPTSAWRGCG